MMATMLRSVIPGFRAAKSPESRADARTRESETADAVHPEAASVLDSGLAPAARPGMTASRWRAPC